MSQPDRINPQMRLTNLPLFQLWHPASLNSSIYSKIGQIHLPPGNFVQVGTGRNYYYANLPLNGSSQIEFQSGDVIGYYQPFGPLRLIGSISKSRYTSYSNNVTSPSSSIDINSVDNTDDNHQPLIEVMFGKIILKIKFILIHACAPTYKSILTHVNTYTRTHTHAHNMYTYGKFNVQPCMHAQVHAYRIHIHMHACASVYCSCTNHFGY